MKVLAKLDVTIENLEKMGEKRTESAPKLMNHVLRCRGCADKAGEYLDAVVREAQDIARTHDNIPDKLTQNLSKHT